MKGTQKVVVTDNKQKQVEMHIDFFKRTQFAIDNEFYLEAIFREYAAMEGRLEVILGILGAPCNKNIDAKIRKDINFSHRVNCLKKIYSQGPEIGKTKLDKKFFENLDKWRKDRNIIVHGFYKNELKYTERSASNRRLAENGLEYARMLYNEAKRLRRYDKSHQDADLSEVYSCFESSCILNRNK